MNDPMNSIRAPMHKLSHAVGDAWPPHSHEAIYSVLPMDEGARILAGAPGGDPAPFERLVACMEPPYLLLYILHTPRGQGEAGRYQSDEVSPEQFQRFMAQFGTYLSSDARFDIWAHSPEENATVVWDRHNRLFAYGPIDRFSAALNALGFSEGEPMVPSPHQHHYWPAFDMDAAALLDYFAWTHSPLRDEDEQ